MPTPVCLRNFKTVPDYLLSPYCSVAGSHPRPRLGTLFKEILFLSCTNSTHLLRRAPSLHARSGAGRSVLSLPSLSPRPERALVRRFHGDLGIHGERNLWITLCRECENHDILYIRTGDLTADPTYGPYPSQCPKRAGCMHPKLAELGRRTQYNGRAPQLRGGMSGGDEIRLHL